MRPIKKFKVVENDGKVYLEIGEVYNEKTNEGEPEIILNGYENMSSRWLAEDLCLLAAGEEPGHGYQHEGENPGGVIVFDNDGWDWEAMSETTRRLLGRLTMGTVARLMG